MHALHTMAFSLIPGNSWPPWKSPLALVFTSGLAPGIWDFQIQCTRNALLPLSTARSEQCWLANFGIISSDWVGWMWMGLDALSHEHYLRALLPEDKTEKLIQGPVKYSWIAVWPVRGQIRHGLSYSNILPPQRSKEWNFKQS